MRMQEINDVLEHIKKFENISDGTYDILTSKSVEYQEGYQVSFVRPEAFEFLSKQGWDIITNHLCKLLNSIAHIGVYGGNPEVSFHCLDKRKALQTMEKYNQESIFDWERNYKYPNSEQDWFILNQLFDKEKVLDYDKIIEEIL